MGNQMSLFEVEFQDYLLSQFKNFPIPEAHLQAYQKKIKRSARARSRGISRGDDLFWLRRDQNLRSQLELLFATLLNSQEIAYIWDAIPKFIIPLTQTAIARKEFADPVSLLKILLDRRLASIYEQIEIDCNGSVGSFTWIMPDGYGDWIAQKKGIEMLKKGQPNLDVKIISFYESSWKALIEDPHLNHAKEQIQFVAYSKEKPSESHSLLIEKFEVTMQGIKWLLEFPTHYIGLPDLLKTQSVPVEMLGQYGFLLAPPFSPHLEGKSMGLHPFEVGILLREEEAKPIPSRLLKARYPYDAMALAYLKTKKGARAYLFLIAALQAQFALSTAIMMPTFACLQESLECPQFLRELASVAKGKIIFSYFDGKRIEWGEGTIAIQIIEIGPCTEEELFALAAASTMPIGCRGDQSFTEAVSLKKSFYYDPPAHAGNFLIDLERFARFHTSSTPLSIWLEGSSRVLFDEDPCEIGKRLAGLYPDLLSLNRDFMALADKIERFANGNQYLRGRLKRIFLHEKHTSLQQAEQELYRVLSNTVKRSQIDLDALKFWNELRKNFELSLQLKIHTQ